MTPAATTAHGGSPALAISNLTVRLLSEFTGRGPTKARTYIQDDLVTIVLRDTLTKAERRLAEANRMALVLDTRRTFQAIMAEPLVTGVEEILGRKVLAFLSANHVDPDVAIESFLLEPNGAEE